MLTLINHIPNSQNTKEIPEVLKEVLKIKTLNKNILEHPHYEKEARELIETF